MMDIDIVNQFHKKFSIHVFSKLRLETYFDVLLKIYPYIKPIWLFSQIV